MNQKVLAISGNRFSRNQVSGRGIAPRGRSDRGGISYDGRGRGTRICTHYGQTGHSIGTWFKKYGFPCHYKQEGLVNNSTLLILASRMVLTVIFFLVMH